MIVGKWHCATAVLFHCWHSVVGWLEVKWRFALHYRLLFICWNNCRVVYVCALVWPLVWQQCIVLCAVSHVQEYAVDESQKYKVWNYVMMRQHSDTGVIIEFLMTTQNHLFLMICHQFVLLWLLKHRKECCGVSVYIYIYVYNTFTRTQCTLYVWFPIQHIIAAQRVLPCSLMTAEACSTVCVSAVFVPVAYCTGMTCYAVIGMWVGSDLTAERALVMLCHLTLCPKMVLVCHSLIWWHLPFSCTGGQGYLGESPHRRREWHWKWRPYCPELSPLYLSRLPCIATEGPLISVTTAFSMSIQILLIMSCANATKIGVTCSKLNYTSQFPLYTFGWDQYHLITCLSNMILNVWINDNGTKNSTACKNKCTNEIDWVESKHVLYTVMNINTSWNCHFLCT